MNLLDQAVVEVELLNGIIIGQLTETRYEDVHLTTEKIKQMNSYNEIVKDEVRLITSSLEHNAKALGKFISSRYEINQKFIETLSRQIDLMQVDAEKKGSADKMLKGLGMGVQKMVLGHLEDLKN